ncbi:GumC family protein [Terriglobus roseus]|uniref:Uncharacterized protein involved in exopolysaccharide biosynthesis n=1 Tax=Terriglobus roseus TaxID=392734 RepID=A0A1H4SJJ9_9BACT|nr:hypothetical protein [Terriglobus roseus]SEC44263.1 Uncharacterized protein involved in exopolysaccharide biosynthesis [Terriglobus roseus]
MKKLPSSLPAYLRLFQRRWLPFVICLILFPGASIYLARTLPRQYRSEATLLVQAHSLTSDLVKSSSDKDVKNEFSNLTNTLLSNASLLKMVNELQLGSDGTTTREAAAEALRLHLSLAMDNERSERQDSAIVRITYTAGSAQQAHDVTQHVADAAVLHHQNKRSEEAGQSIVFLDSEVQRARQEVNEKQQLLQRFRMQHNGSLPEQSMANLQSLNSMEALLMANNAAIDRMTEDTGRPQSASARSSLDATAMMSPEERQLAALQEEYQTKRQTYTLEHPDMVRLKGQINDLEMATRSQRGKDKPPSSERAETRLPPVRNLSQDLEDRRRRQREITGEIQRIKASLQASGLLSSNLVELQEQYESARKRLDALETRQANSTLVQTLESSNADDTISVLDNASFPTAPFSPNTRMLIVAGSGLGIALGLALSLLSHLLDDTLHDEGDVALYLSAPLIASIPSLTGNGKTT